ncbi:MAG: cytochrome c biogenesis protein, partial [Synechococcaceae cyanobacterium RL_1_2]|nr:cytochrome c biogenesis protein [Synechococcaceae cyanobacterium RL_1_2]
MTSIAPNSPGKLKLVWKSIIRTIADLKLAIALLITISLCSISGTVIEQGQTLTFYQSNYPEDPALWGFLSWKVLLSLGLNHVYSTWWYLGLLALFGASLIACTYQRQWPALKVAKKWQYYDQSRQFKKLAFAIELDRGSLKRVQELLSQRRYELFTEDSSLYGRKGLAGKIGPIIVHGGMIVVLIGSTIGALGGFFAQESVLSGNNFQINNVIEEGPFADSYLHKPWSVNVNRFWIDYTPKGAVDQFYSDLSIIDSDGQELLRKTIFVNQPLRYDGITFYQTSWAIGAVQVKINNSPVFQLPMASLPVEGD